MHSHSLPATHKIIWHDGGRQKREQFMAHVHWMLSVNKKLFQFKHFRIVSTNFIRHSFTEPYISLKHCCNILKRLFANEHSTILRKWCESWSKLDVGNFHGIGLILFASSVQFYNQLIVAYEFLMWLFFLLLHIFQYGNRASVYGCHSWFQA